MMKDLSREICLDAYGSYNSIHELIIQNFSILAWNYIITTWILHHKNKVIFGLQNFMCSILNYAGFM